MESIIEALSYPYIQRAIIAGVFSGALLSILGIFVVLRKMAFFSDGIAHTALAGIAIGVLLNQQPLLWAVIMGVIFAVAIYYLERRTQLAPDSLIGILFTSSLALGVILMNYKRGYNPDLISFLFGNILLIQSHEVYVIVPVSIILIAFLLINYRKYIFICLNEELAHLAGIRVALHRLLLYVLLAVSTILAIKMFGIILVSALLIIPVSFGKLFSNSARILLAVSLIFVEIIILGGIALSLIFKMQTGPVIILTGTVLFILGMVVTRRLAA
jgi:zinc transport system permease protein